MNSNKGRTPKDLLLGSAGLSSKKLDAVAGTLWPKPGPGCLRPRNTWAQALREFWSAHPFFYSGLAASWLAIAFLQGDSGSEDSSRPSKLASSSWALYRAIPESELNALADFAANEPASAAPAAARPRSSLQTSTTAA